MNSNKRWAELGEARKKKKKRGRGGRGHGKEKKKKAKYEVQNIYTCMNRVRKSSWRERMWYRRVTE